MFSVFHWTSKFKLQIGALLFVSLYLCQSEAEMETNGYYSFNITTEMDFQSLIRVCRGNEIQSSDVTKLVLDGQEMQTFSCECSFIIDRNVHKLKDSTTPILTIFTTGFVEATVNIMPNWFTNDHINEDQMTWKFNVKPEQHKTVVTFKELDSSREILLYNKTTNLHLTRSNKNIFLDLKCQGPDNNDITTVLVSSGDTMSTTTGGMPSTETREIEGQSTSHIPLQSTETSVSQNSFFYYIIAAVVGGVLLLIIVIIVIIIVCIRNRKQRQDEDLKRPGSSPAVLYSNLNQSQKNNLSGRKNPMKRQTTVEDDQLVNQSEVVGTTYADINPTSLVLRDAKTETAPGGDQGQEQGLTYADLDWAGGNGKQPANDVQDPRDQLYAKPQKRGIKSK